MLLFECDIFPPSYNKAKRISFLQSNAKKIVLLQNNICHFPFQQNSCCFLCFRLLAVKKTSVTEYIGQLADFQTITSFSESIFEQRKNENMLFRRVTF
jgi:hypothetical protein